MRRLNVFLFVILVAALSVFSLLATFLPRQLSASGMPGMAGMMNEGHNGMPIPLWPAILAVSISLILIAVTYVVAFPSITYSDQTQSPKETSIGSSEFNDPIDIVMRITKPDERAALEVLKNNGGVCLQKDITYKTGLSKLKTHRIVARLAERGIIQVRKIGKTNEISVPAWLRKQSPSETRRQQ